MVKKVSLSLLSGLAILLITWVYQNYDFSFSVEDGFFKKISLWKYKIFPAFPKQKASFTFINTGKDLALVEDTTEYGNVAVSDREKLYELMKLINAIPQKPLYIVLDIQFYYVYTGNPRVDSLLGREIKKNKLVMVPILKDGKGDYVKPLYEAAYAYSDYQTFGSGFNKFRIVKNGYFSSIPVKLQECIDSVVYKRHFLYSTFNDSLCLSAIWPTLYLRNDQLQNNALVQFAQYYNLGELLLDLEANPDNMSKYFQGKILFIGNFEGDTHATPVGKISGPVMLANIYLSLLNREHVISYGFLIALFIVFSSLSYVAWFKKMPEIKLNFNFLFSSYLSKFVKGYVSYFGCMFFLSVICILYFNVQVALFLPSFIFAGIEYFRQKKYRSGK